MTVSELYQALNQRIPQELSCPWDNDGLMVCPEPTREAERILVALDVTDEIAEQAIEDGYDVIVSHHPLIFHPLKNLDFDDPVAKKVMKLVRNGIAVMSFHTRLDAVAGGVNDTLANALGLCQVRPFGKEGIGRIGCLPHPLSLEDFAARVKEILCVPALLVSDAGLAAEDIAVLGGAGSDEVEEAALAGADTYLSGELAHHHLTDAPERGMNLIAAGHFHTENLVCRTLKKLLRELDDECAVTVADSNPIRLL